MRNYYLLLFLIVLSTMSYGQKVDRDYVLLEIATGDWCGYCPGAALAADDLVEKGHKVAVIENHYNDIFETNHSKERIDYYGIISYPTAVFDGSVVFPNGDPDTSVYVWYQPIADSLIDIKSEFSLRIYGERVGDEYEVYVKIKNETDYVSEGEESLRLRFAITESHIELDWKNLTEMNFVNRIMIPDHDGLNISNLDLKEETDLDFSFTFNNSWNDQNCELVAFVQDDQAPKKVLQTFKVSLNELSPAPIVADFDADHRKPCFGTSINYADESVGGSEIAYEWTFEGGTPSTSTEENPTVTYNETGVYSTTLKVTDQFSTDTKEVDNFVSVIGAPDAPMIPEGDDMICNGGSFLYEIEWVENAQDFEWELEPTEAGTLSAEFTQALFTPADSWTGDFTLRVKASNDCGIGEWSENFEGSVFNGPNTYSLEGESGYCESTDGTELSLSNSETGIKYELFVDGESAGVVVDGTGSSISFGMQTSEGIYTAKANNGSCVLPMDNEIEVFIMFAPEAPGSPTGEVLVCNTQASDYLTEGTEDADDYSWAIDPIEAGTASSEGMEVTVEWNSSYSGTAYLSVSGVNECGEGTYSENLEIVVEDSPAPVIDGLTLVCDYETATYMVSENEGSTYTWEIVGGTILNGEGTASVEVQWGQPGVGTATVTEQSANGCYGFDADFEVTIDNCTGIEEPFASKDVTIFPNPISDVLNIKINRQLNQDAKILISNNLGQLILKQDLVAHSDQQSILFDVSHLDKGLYIFMLQNANEVVITKKLIKN